MIGMNENIDYELAAMDRNKLNSSFDEWLGAMRKAFPQYDLLISERLLELKDLYDLGYDAHESWYYSDEHYGLDFI